MSFFKEMNAIEAKQYIIEKFGNDTDNNKTQKINDTCKKLMSLDWHLKMVI